MTMTTDWRALAACRDLDPELFFPVGTPGSPAYEAMAAPARAVCAGCPVAAECLDEALATGSEGIWGGFDEAGRRALRASAAAA